MSSDNSWGERFLNRYERYLGVVQERDIYRPIDGRPSIQMFYYDNVVEGCKTLATFGISHYSSDIGMITEIVCSVDAAWYAVSFLLAGALSTIIKNKISLGRGISIDGISTAMPNFASTFNKEAIYFTSPFDFPKDFQHLVHAEGTGHMLLAMLISKPEYLYLRQHGVEAFEDLLEKSSPDIYDLARESCVSY